MDTLKTDTHILKERYETIIADKESDYCLVVLTLKDFSDFLHWVGEEKYEAIIDSFFTQISSVLGTDDAIAHTHFDFFTLLVRCAHNLDALHPLAAAMHFKVRDGMEATFGKKLYIAMGFYPIQAPYTTFYEAQYFANLSQKGKEYKYKESNYDMYGVSYIDRQEAFRKLESSVQQAMEHGDFKLYLQPKVNLATGEVDGAEALVRWLDPERGMIPLGDFLPQMEENGYIRDLDCYLFNIACQYMDRWLNEYNQKVMISFNLNSAYFKASFFMPEYKEVFGRYNIPPDCVRIEVLESIVLDDMDHLRALVQEIYDFGFSCALDDFGSGFSSFNILTNVPLSELKIDRSLFQNYDNPNERSLVSHIIDISHSMGMVCVAEGIETQAYADYLKEIGCDFIQGFYYYRPMPIEEFESRFITKSIASKYPSKPCP